MKKFDTKNLVLAALFTALTAVLSQILLPIGPVPFNLALLAIFLTGMLLPPAWACISMGVYLLLGAVGVPVFAGLVGGPAILFGKTGGYILGYIFVAGLTALGARQKKPWITFVFMGIGLVLCYALGTVWFMVITGATFAQSLVWCVIPFIIPDLCKAAAAYFLGKTLQKRLPH